MKLKVLHLISETKMGGIKSVLESLMASRLTENVEFLVSHKENFALKKRWQPNIIIVHHSCNWIRLVSLFFLKIINRKSKIVIHEHHYSEGFEKCNVSHKFRFRLMLKLSYGLADRVVSISSAQSKWLEQNRLVSSSKLILILQCRVLNNFLAVPSKTSGHPFVLGAYGRFHAQKGFDVLLESMKLISHLPIKLYIGGEGSEEFQLKQLAQGLNNVEFIGRVDNIPEFLQTCDAVVIPSRWEPMGIVCLEAKAAGRAVIAADVDGLSEQTCSCGILVPPQNPVKLAQAIASLPEQDLEALGKIGRKSVERAWEKYLDDWKVFLSQMTDTAR